MKKVFSLILVSVLVLSICSLPATAQDTEEVPLTGESITVYNWGDYIANGEDGFIDVNKEFTKRTGIKVNYDTFATNEELYTKLKSGGSYYDVIIPSDYMISKMIAEDMLEPLNYDNIPNAKFISEELKEHCGFDPEGKYSVPYAWGRVGILYNEKYVDDPVDSWSILWNQKYKNKILMFDNPRDAFGIAQKKLGMSFNTNNPEDWRAAAEELKIQKSNVNCQYVMDQIFSKMGNEEAYLAPYYAGDALTIYGDNPNVKFAIPKEGTNLFVDAMCIPKGSKNKEAAEKYINFICETDIAFENISYINYSSPHVKAAEMHKEYLAENFGDWAVEVIYPETLDGCETFIALDNETYQLADRLWLEVRNSGDYTLTIILVIGALALLIGFIVFLRIKKHRRENA
ncbi:MAG TPA: spermidine/putrescine ABC transporter substrate-binding protein [Clostridiales bacterium]|nr:spermidine/putrescine ABC transporter substrate-binding protein [Clostridiales bacterium]